MYHNREFLKLSTCYVYPTIYCQFIIKFLTTYSPPKVAALGPFFGSTPPRGRTKHNYIFPMYRNVLHMKRMVVN